ncbi:hypothetical protein [Providencia stuartii]
MVITVVEQSSTLSNPSGQAYPDGDVAPFLLRSNIMEIAIIALCIPTGWAISRPFVRIAESFGYC